MSALCALAFLGPVPSLVSHVVVVKHMQSPRSIPSSYRQRLARGSDLDGPGYVPTEQTFATDAGRDLMFAGLTQDRAIEILTGEGKDDRYIAAERLQFFPSEKATRALIDTVQQGPTNDLSEKVTRRKCVEVLGRLQGKYLREHVVETVRQCLHDPDPYTVEVAVWTLSELQVTEYDLLEEITSVLHQKEVNKRVVIQTLMQLGHRPAADRIQAFTNSDDLSVASAANAFLFRIDGDEAHMTAVQKVLSSENLNARRSAIEDIGKVQHFPSLSKVTVAPNSLVLRSRAVRSILDHALSSGEATLDDVTMKQIDLLIWDHPFDLNLLGQANETRKSRQLERCIQRLHKNDALPAYLATKTLIEDHQSERAASMIQESFVAAPYFDYFAAYHLFKAIGWVGGAAGSFDLLIHQFRTLPPRFFNHQLAAGLSLAVLGKQDAIEDLFKVATSSKIWELKYACLIAVEKLNDGGSLRRHFYDDQDILIRSRARSAMDFDHLWARWR